MMLLGMKSSALIILLAACNIDCNMMSTNSPDETSLVVFRDAAMKMICRAMYPDPNCPKITEAELIKPADCADFYKMGHIKSGIYEIWPMSRVSEGKSLNVYCDMDTAGGGWTVIQRRGDFNHPSDHFYKDWQSYKEGFGNNEEDFWLGNDQIFALTNQKKYSVRFDLKDMHQTRKYARYDNFWIDDEMNNYTLHISEYSGDAEPLATNRLIHFRRPTGSVPFHLIRGDSMEFHNGQKFTTIDQDNDEINDGNCAVQYKGAWWYKNCHHANLNGEYHKEKYTGEDGIRWHTWKGWHGESLTWTAIKIRPKNFKTGF